MGTMDLHQFKTGLLGPESGIAKGMDNVLDLLNGEDMGHSLDTILIPQLGPRNCRRSTDGLGTQELLASAVFDLDSGHRTLFPDIFCQPGQTGDMFVAGNTQMAVRRLGTDVIHIGVFYNDHAGAACGLLPVIPHQTFADGTVHIAHAGRLRCLHDTVLEGHTADFSRCEQMGKELGHKGIPPY